MTQLRAVICTEQEQTGKVDGKVLSILTRLMLFRSIIIAKSSLIFWYFSSVRGVRTNCCCSWSASGLSFPLCSFLFNACKGTTKQQSIHHTKVFFLNRGIVLCLSSIIGVWLCCFAVKWKLTFSVQKSLSSPGHTSQRKKCIEKIRLIAGNPQLPLNNNTTRTRTSLWRKSERNCEW